MRPLLERTFIVSASPPESWHAVTDAEAWPGWARHIRRVELTPAGPVGPSTEAVITLANRTKARVVVTEYEAGRRFRWDGRFLWLGLSYDHVIEPAAAGTRITFTVAGDGPGIGSIGRVFARIYGGNLDRAIPNLQAQLGSGDALPRPATT